MTSVAKERTVFTAQEVEAMRTVGEALRLRRQALHMSLMDAEDAMGGMPSYSVLSRIETGKVRPTADTVERIARGLILSRDVLLNSFGFTADWQRDEAVERLLRIVREKPAKA